MATLERAIEIAVEAHKGQVDKAGAPYILHPLRLMLSFDSETERIVAVLHDVLEDTPWTSSQLREEGFSAEVLEAVDRLTRRKGETFDKFTERAGSHPIARRVKIADLKDNMNILRIRKVTGRDLRRLKRYHRAWQFLTENT